MLVGKAGLLGAGRGAMKNFFLLPKLWHFLGLL